MKIFKIVRNKKNNTICDTSNLALFGAFDNSPEYTPLRDKLDPCKHYCFWGQYSEDKKTVKEMFSGRTYTIQDDNYFIVDGTPFEEVKMFPFIKNKQPIISFSDCHLTNILLLLKCIENSKESNSLWLVSQAVSEKTPISTMSLVASEIELNKRIHQCVLEKIGKMNEVRALEHSDFEHI